jgi:putative FmdB family regulatory protein
MPIYEYRCKSCGYQNDYLQKLSEPQLTDCPECGKSTFAKQVTAAGFQLKGSGWYATDFKNNGAAKSVSKKDEGKGKNEGDAGKSGSASPGEGGKSDSGSPGGGGKSDSGSPASGGSEPAATGAGTGPANT